MSYSNLEKELIVRLCLKYKWKLNFKREKRDHELAKKNKTKPNPQTNHQTICEPAVPNCPQNLAIGIQCLWHEQTASFL